MDWYANALVKAVNAEIDFDDNMTATLHTSTYAISRTADDYVNDLTNELATSGGYTSGGIALGVVSRTLTVANSWGVSRANSTAYVVGDVVRPATGNTFLYRATNSGTSGGSIPTYPTVLGQTVVDGGVTWECYGIAIIVLTSANPITWATATFTGVRYCVMSDRTAGASSAQPLVAVHDYVSDQAGGGGAFTLNPHPALGLAHIIIT